jgi:Tol biopolymer transport system component
VDQRGLVERARRGDHDAFAALVGASVARLDATAWLIVRDRELAHDVVQDALMRAWRDLPGLRDPGRFDAWLHRLLVNTCLMAIRRRHRRPIEVELEPIVLTTDADPAGVIADRDELDRAFAHLDRDGEVTTEPRTRVDARGRGTGRHQFRTFHRGACGMSARLYSEDDLTQWLETTGRTPSPEYVDSLLARTARSRQRSAWRFPERWLPVDITARAPALSRRRVPVRMLAVVALVVLAIAAATLYVGSQRRLPPPFGPAANGMIVFVAPTNSAWVDMGDYQRPMGDILTVDPATGATSVLVGGPTEDGYPVVSLDGTRVAFVRETDAGQALYVVDFDGGRPRPLTSGPFQQINDVAWSPNGESVAFAAVDDELSTLWMARSDGSDAHQVDLKQNLSVVLPQWRPPNGAELLLVGSTSPSAGFLPDSGYRDLWGGFQEPTGTGIGLYMVNADGSNLRPITESTGSRYDYGLVAWTPTGDRIFTQSADPAHFGYTRIRELEPDGALIATIEPTSGAETVSPVVSPDGSRLAYADLTADGEWTIRVVSIDGSSDAVETGATFAGAAAAFRWSPDGEILIVTHHFSKETWLFDADGGPGQRATWTDPGSNAWQRLAP